MALSRRRFIGLTGVAAAAAATASLPLLHLRKKHPIAAGNLGAAPRPKLGSWQDLYRQRWSWDQVAKGSHGWLNCRSACAWNLYVKNGIVVREEQTALYESSEPGVVPDFNPRGCNKGACYTEVMYGPSRLTVPLKRVGERGGGQWQRVSWDEALDDIAGKLVDIAVTHGTDAVFHDLGPHFDNGATTAARTRFFTQFGGSMADDWGEIGDLNIGATLTFGFPHMGGTSDEWFLSDHIVVWMMNPAVTQIPDAHFLTEARYRGAVITTVDPIYSATTTHADHWLPIRPGTDAALALATARYIWESGHADWAYVREQTDFPLLVRADNGRFLRESDLKAGGREGQLFWWDPKSKAPAPAPGTIGASEARLWLDGREPPLEGRFSTHLADGREVALVTVGTLVKERLAEWTFEKAATVTGLHVDQIRGFAERFAAAERPMILSSWGSNRYLHSDLMNRSKILCLSLKGAVGKRGAGFHSTGWFAIEGFEFFADKHHPGRLGQLDQTLRGLGAKDAIDTAVKLVTRRKTQLEMMYELAAKASREAFCVTNSASLNLAYGGVKNELDQETLEAGYPHKLSTYEAESLQKEWMPVFPARTAPKAWITGGNNVLRRSNLPQNMLAHLWPQLQVIVDINPKLTFTGMHADYLLPAAGYYEKPGIKYPVAYVPYMHYCDQAVKPLGESKDEWEIYALLAEKVEAIARKRNVSSELPPCHPNLPVDLKTVSERFTMNGRFGPKDAEAVNAEIIASSPSVDYLSVDELKKTGFGKYANTGSVLFQSQLYNEDWQGEGVLTVAQHMVKDRWPWPTVTGRQQFYIDHPWFIEAGEHLPTHKESPKAGGDQPFRLVSCHARWSVHSIWRDNPMLLRLQRGEPALYLNPLEANKLGIADHDWAEVSNRYGSIRMRIKHSTMVQPGVAYYFHAWEPFQFPEHKSYKWITPGLMNPLHFAGGEGQVGWIFGIYEPGTHVQDTRVTIKPARAA